jgi:hypothetical protein
MKTIFVSVWLLSNGTLQGDPWIPFKSAQACENYSRGLASSPAKMLFLVGCVDAKALSTFRAFEMALPPGLSK